MRPAAQAAIDNLIARYPALNVCRPALMTATEKLIACYKKGGKVLTCGNGGSAADAEHIVGELMKGFVKKRPLTDVLSQRLRDVADGFSAEYMIKGLQMPLAAIPLVSGVALPTAFANDQAPDLVFAQQVLGLARPDDILLAISTSGNSTNVIYAIHAAKAMGVFTVALTGKGGGKIGAIADVNICVHENETYRIQELHLPIYHALCIACEAEFFDV